MNVILLALGAALATVTWTMLWPVTGLASALLFGPAFLISTAFLIAGLRWVADGVDVRIKLINIFSRIYFRVSGMYGSSAARFNRSRFERLSGYTALKRPDGKGKPDSRGIFREDILIPGSASSVRVRLFASEPVLGSADGSAPVLLYIHGGGYVISHCDSVDYDDLCAKFAHRGFIVASVEYRLAPENPFPAGLEDAYAVLAWCHANPETTPSRSHKFMAKADLKRLIVGGDSAGGNFATVLSHLAHDRKTPTGLPTTVALPIRQLLLIYPSLDRTGTSASMRRHADAYIIPRPVTDFFMSAYCPTSMTHEQFVHDPRVSPLLRPSLTGLPPATVLTVELDPLLDCGVRYVERLREAGIRCEHLHFTRTVHGFFTVAFLPEARRAFTQCIDAMAKLW